MARIICYVRDTIGILEGMQLSKMPEITLQGYEAVKKYLNL